MASGHARLSGPPGTNSPSWTDESYTIERLEGLAEWTRNLAGVITVGVGLEGALVATLRTSPDVIRPEVTTLVGRIRSRWNTAEALRAFADQFNDSTGDLVAATLILADQKRADGLSQILSGLAARPQRGRTRCSAMAARECCWSQRLRLNAKRARMTANGVFGVRTTAVSNAQNRYGLKATKTMDDPTWAKLLRRLGRASIGSAVQALRVELHRDG